MKKLCDALLLIQKYNAMPIQQVAEEFAAWSNQEIPQKVIDDFELTGLTNIDFLTNNVTGSYKTIFDINNDFEWYYNFYLSLRRGH